MSSTAGKLLEGKRGSIVCLDPETQRFVVRAVPGCLEHGQTTTTHSTRCVWGGAAGEPCRPPLRRPRWRPTRLLPAACCPCAPRDACAGADARHGLV